MEEASARGDLAAVKEYFISLPRVRNDNVNSDELSPESANILHQSLCTSASNGHLSTFTFLLHHTPITRPVIRSVCALGDVKFLEAMLDRNFDVNKMDDGASPLLDTLLSEGCTLWMLRNGANPNVKQFPKDQDLDILTEAAQKASPRVVELLIEHGAKVRGTVALHAAAGASGNQIDGNTWKADDSRIEVMRILLANGADVNEMEPDPKGPKNRRPRTWFTGTPLHHAIKSGSLDAVKYLLAHRANLRAPSWSGHRPLGAAQESKRQDVIEVIEQYEQIYPS